ncbi:MAG: hypothetical protein RLY86_2056 [Pseudomonadota bacterium]|jgi:LacI family transcriptional regulator
MAGTRKAERLDEGDDESSLLTEGKRATINDIARIAKVSKKTVSRVINQSPLVSKETRDRVDAVIQQMGFIPDPQARGLAFRRAFLVGLVYDNPNAQFIVMSQYGILDGLRGSGFELVLYPCDRGSPSLFADVRAFIERQKLAAVVLLPPVSENEALVELLRDMDCAYVRVASATLDEPSHMIASNDGIGTAEAAEHLYGLGHRRIAVIKGPGGYRSAKERFNGFRDALIRHGHDIPPDYQIEGGYTFESGIACAERLLDMKPRPTAIFCGNDEMAAGVYHVALLRGLRIPDDLSVVGFDDTPLAARMWPPLTTVRWPIRDMGHMAAELVLAQIREGEGRRRMPMVEPRLTIRRSTAAPKD